MKCLNSFFSKKKVLVTGGAGFIGSHLVEKLVELGADVTILDNFSTGSLSNLQSILTQVSIIYGDISQPLSALKAVSNVDIVFHLAAFVSVPQSILYPKICKKINVEGTLNILKACKQYKIKTLVFSSSSAVYGNKNEPCKEDDPTNPQTPYAWSKYEGEKLCLEFAEKYEINTAILRYFNVFGDRQPTIEGYGAVVPTFKKQILAQKPITIHGDGKQTRDFIDVKDVIQATLKVATLSPRGEIFNVGSEESINLFQLIKKLEKELKTNCLDITFKPARTDEVYHSRANCKKLKEITRSL